MDELPSVDFFDSLLVILVVYKMKINESTSYQSLTEALSLRRNSTTLFIYDNSPQPQMLTEDQGWKTIYCHDPSNAGVSKAYNEGFNKAKELNKKWLLLVDQDTFFPVSSFDSYYKEINGVNNRIAVPVLKDKLGIVSPFKFNFGTGARLAAVKNSVQFSLSDYFFINSGLLVDINLFEAAGGYDENLPLDFSDIAFACRLRTKAERFVVTEMICQHELSATQPMELSERLSRFEKYVRASRYITESYSLPVWILFRAFVRAVKFSFRYSNFKFLALFFSRV